jgi:hypothetical protein
MRKAVWKLTEAGCFDVFPLLVKLHGDDVRELGYFRPMVTKGQGDMSIVPVVDTEEIYVSTAKDRTLEARKVFVERAHAVVELQAKSRGGVLF